MGVKLVSTLPTLFVLVFLPSMAQEQPKDADSLIHALKDKNSDVRLHAVEALGKINDTRVADSLSLVFNDNK